MPPFLHRFARRHDVAVLRQITRSRATLRKRTPPNALQNLQRAIAHRQHRVRKIKIAVITHRPRKSRVVQRRNQLRHRRVPESRELMRGRRALVVAPIEITEDIARSRLAPLLPVLLAQPENPLRDLLLHRQLRERLDRNRRVCVVFRDEAPQRRRRRLRALVLLAANVTALDPLEHFQQLAPRHARVPETQDRAPHQRVRQIPLQTRAKIRVRSIALVARRHRHRHRVKLRGLIRQPVPPATPRQHEHLAALRQPLAKAPPALLVPRLLPQRLELRRGERPQVQRFQSHAFVLLDSSLRIGEPRLEQIER